MNEKEVAEALSCLKNNGLSINLPDTVKNSLNEHFLFDGDDHIFKQLVKCARAYCEYGSGKSTVWVGKNFPEALKYSVDTSMPWVTRVNAQLGADIVKHVDVGDVGDWGLPKNLNYRKYFVRYAESPWEQQTNYDVVLIDGRFRVLCFLTSLLKCDDGTTIVFDDYRDRPQYHVVEDFIKPIDFCGRQAIFKVEDKAQINLSEVEEERILFAYVLD